MACGGLKILVNGRVEHCYKVEIDFDEASIKINEKPVEDFDRKSLVVMSITKEDMEVKRHLSQQVIREIADLPIVADDVPVRIPEGMTEAEYNGCLRQERQLNDE